MKNKNMFSIIILTIISLIFLYAGISKVIGVDMVVQKLLSMNMPYWFIVLLGITEILLVVGLWIWHGKLRPLVLTLMFGIISGALAASISISVPTFEIIFLIILDILIFASIGIDQRFFVFIEDIIDDIKK